MLKIREGSSVGESKGPCKGARTHSEVTGKPLKAFKRRTECSDLRRLVYGE